ncbi:hypothetical protein niasHT_029072 [Heterodera trifolii]|uniref:Uncharacterized protein n=1 Tax=Heterodera trifolii TaxID=157864 RepID=A0ABD2KS19_9BILA
MIAAFVLVSVMLLLLDNAAEAMFASSSGGGNQITLGAKFDPKKCNEQVQFVWKACADDCKKLKKEKMDRRLVKEKVRPINWI